MLLLLAWAMIASTPACTGLQDVVRIGGLFQTMEAAQELAFRYAADAVNADYKILHNLTLIPHLERVPEHDSFQVSRTVCKLLGIGVVGIFGPQSSDTSDHVQSMCDAMDIPHIETRWDVRQKRQDFLVNLYPHPATLSRVFADLVTAWKWKSFTLIYEDGEGLIRVGDLVKFYPPRNGYTVTIRQLDPNIADHRPILRQIRDSGEKNIVLDCSVEKLFEIFKQAQQVGLVVVHMNYIVTNLDLHTINLEPYQWSNANITGIRLVDPQRFDVQMALKSWSEKEMRKGVMLDITPDTLRLSTALIYDAVFLFAKALSRLDGPKVEMVPLDCNSDVAWHHGSSLINFMKDGQSHHRGLTGLIQFDNEGFRSKFELDVVELTLDGIQKVGTWNSTEGLNLTRIPPPVKYGNSDIMRNQTFIVLTALSKPYGMMKMSSYALIGNDRYEGFGIDLIKEISLMLGFNYTYELQEDAKYGTYNKTTKKWDGMVEALLEHRADLAITDLTINADRESAVDFTMPFMTLGIGILYKAPKKEAPKLFSFLSTFSTAVWIYTLAAYTGVSLIMFVIGRIAPKEWTNPYPCIQDPDELENQFNLKNSFWFTIGSMLQQGSEIAPIANSTRMVAGMWWFFTLIMGVSYTANLAAVLTASSLNQPFKSAEHLANQNVISYGAKRGGTTAGFFRDSKNAVYQRMWEYMNSHPEVWTKDNAQGQEWVRNKNYAYLMESTSIEYVTERDCKVKQVGALLDHKGYGIAMRKDSVYRNALSTAVLHLQETGVLTQLKQKWWKEERGGGACEVKPTGAASQLTLAHVGGVFVVLGIGVAIATVFTIVEFLYDVMQTSRKKSLSFRLVLLEECKFVVCLGTRRIR